jgi:hypothetical protein
VPAPDIEQLVIASLRSEAAPCGAQEDPAAVDRESVLQHVRRVEVRSKSVLIEITLPPDEQTDGVEAAPAVRRLTVPWSPPPGRVARTVVAPPSDAAAPLIPMRAGTRETLLVAIAKARQWSCELSSHQVTSFGIISAREGCTERYVRSILPLAFLAPEVVKAALDGRLPDTYGASRLAANSPLSWDEQKQVLGLHGRPGRQGPGRAPEIQSFLKSSCAAAVENDDAPAPRQARKNLAPPHSITSSARARRDCGIVRPSAFAAFKLTAVSNLVGVCTGRSPGAAPRRIRST